MGLVIKAEKDWRDVGQPQVAMHRHSDQLEILSLGSSKRIPTTVQDLTKLPL